MFDLIIIGGGPAGVSAGVYAARKRLKTLLISPNFEGQSFASEGIENWIGTKKISGQELSNNLREHLLSNSGDTLEVKEGESVTNITKSDDYFSVISNKDQYQTKTILITTGSHRRKLDIPGAKEYENKGITYCATCDGPIFSGMDVVVIGGGNSALESSAQLLAYCKSVTLLNNEDKPRGDEVTVEKLLKNQNFKIINNVKLLEIKGDKFVTGIKYEDTQTKEQKEISISGIFVEIGSLPTTAFAKNVVELNQYGQIPVDFKNQQTKTPGIWSAGDCTDGLYHQNNIASGDAVKALEDIYVWLKTK